MCRPRSSVDHGPLHPQNSSSEVPENFVHSLQVEKMLVNEADESTADGELEIGCRRCCQNFHGSVCFHFERKHWAFRSKSKIKIAVATVFVALLVMPYLSTVLNGRTFRAGSLLENKQRRTVFGLHNRPDPAKVLANEVFAPPSLKERDEDVSGRARDAKAQLVDFSERDAKSINAERHGGKINDSGAISSLIAPDRNDGSSDVRSSEESPTFKSSAGANFSSHEDVEVLERQHSSLIYVSQAEEMKPPKRSLEEVLEAAALPSKTVIIASLNAAWAENNTMIDIFLESFHEGNDTARLLKNLIIVAFDQRAFERCLRIHEHCLEAETSGVDFSQEKFINSEDFLKMMWRRVQFLGTVLERGYNFIFSDADILWLRDPFPRLTEVLELDEQQVDMAVASDHFNGNATDVAGNAANTGFIYARATDRTRMAYRYWYDARHRYPRKKEQDVFNAIKLQRGFRPIGLRLRILDNQFFAGFCAIGSTDMAKVVTMHGACCRGLNAKLHDLRTVLDRWHVYLANSQEDSSVPSAHFRRPRACPRSWPRRPILQTSISPNQSSPRAL